MVLKFSKIYMDKRENQLYKLNILIIIKSKPFLETGWKMEWHRKATSITYIYIINYKRVKTIPHLKTNIIPLLFLLIMPFKFKNTTSKQKILSCDYRTFSSVRDY